MASGQILFTSTLVESLVATTGASPWTNVRGVDQINVHVNLGTSGLGQIQGSLRPTQPTSAMAEITISSVGASGIVAVTGPLEWIRYVQTGSSSSASHAWAQGRKIK